MVKREVGFESLSYYILHTCKLLRKSKISYVINQIFKFQVFFFCLKLYIKNKFVNQKINNI